MLLNLNIMLWFCVRYQGELESNMIIVDVELPSGYAMESWRDTNEVRELS